MNNTSNKSDFDPLIDAVASRYVVGIDLGTTNSAATYIDTEADPWEIRVLGVAQLVAMGETETLDTLPSFYFQPAAGTLTGEANPLALPWTKGRPTACVGSLARDETARTSGRGIASAKSWLCNSNVDRTAALLPWHGAADVDRLSPVDVSAKYLEHIRQAWDRQFPDYPLAEQDIVLTLPASFDEVARELTVAAAADAGLPKVVLIEEPQAAFYAWVYKHQSDWESRVAVGQKILVCDIGGGTTDFTLIRVRKSRENDGDEASGNKIQFHRVAVGNHLILGGDNLDLAIAKYIEQKITDGGQLEPYQWDVLVGTSRSIKERMLAGFLGAQPADQSDDVSEEASDRVTVSLPSRGSKLIGGSLQTEVTRSEICDLIISGFLPDNGLHDKPQSHASGFQEFGLPYASDAAISRYLADFLVTHASAGADSNEGDENSLGANEIGADEIAPDDLAAIRPDVVLFNGGFFASPLLRETVVERLQSWFRSASDEAWQPQVLENDRLDLAVARGAAYYGIVRRDQGVRIAASLARSYYIGVGNGQAICVMPGNAEPGQEFTLAERAFKLTISQPVEFSLFVSSIRLADRVGEVLDVNAEQMTALPPIRTVLRAKSKNEKGELSVRLRIGLTEIGTIDLSCHEVDSDRSWRLQFDIRSTTQTELEDHQAVGETQGFVDEQVWQGCELAIASVFEAPHEREPKSLVRELANVLEAERAEWPMSLLRRIWEALIERESGRRKSAKHEARWLNLLGYSLRPGYGVAVDDWRVTETWRLISGKLMHGAPNIHTESLILWRRIAGGLSRGQQLALAEPLLTSIRGLLRQTSGKKGKSNAAVLRPEESVEVWRLLGSLELLPTVYKTELGNTIVNLKDKPKLKPARDAMIWALGRLGQRTPLYGPLNTVVSVEQVTDWLNSICHQADSSAIERLAVVQMARLTDDRYRDLAEPDRNRVLRWLDEQNAAEQLVKLVREGGKFDAEEQGKVFGEALPQGLRLE